ncbi:MAG: DNA-directed DNA polymerase [Archaeoglobaceae archaeon]|nr:DNA-directed DNA polymerase [Archaeoglobaceae archaeon]MDW8117387.1 DNA-directed DNA polymerase [Archaeoglobaceae archaeon]
MVEGWLLDVEYVTFDDSAVLRLWCKDHEPFIAYDKNFKPYFYVLDIDEDTIQNAMIRTKKELISPASYEKTKVKFFGREIPGFIIYAKHPQHVPKLRDFLSKFGEVREADIPFAYRYLIDKDLACLDGIRIKGKESEGKLRSYEIEEVERVNKEIPELNILAFDCEMLSSFGMPDPEKDPIIVISVKWSNEREEILHGNERTIIQDFVQIIKEIDPDLIVGYNQDAFDWPYIRKRAEKLKISLDIGRDGSLIKFKGGRPKIAGRLNVDLYDIALRITDVKIKKLENIAEFLGAKIDIEDIEAKDINRYWQNDKEKVLTHAKRDVIHTYMIAKELLPMHYELARLIRLPLDDISRMGRGKQVDWLLLSEARKLGEIAPNAEEVLFESYEGALVIEPERGLHENVAELDFASMYPSIMIAYNISPDTLAEEGDCYVAPEVNYKFRKQPEGFFRRILKMLIEKRREIKTIMKSIDEKDPRSKLLDIKQQTLKILTNSFYGYMGWAGARWYCRKCAEATTAWGRYFIKTSAKIAQDLEFKVLYGDTDSIFISKTGLGLEELEEEVEKLILEISKRLPVQIELDELFKTIFFVEKKRYAGLTAEDKILVRGLEVRRGDWCELAKKAQKGVIEIILKEKDPEKAMSYIKEIVESIRAGKIKLEDVVIYKGLTKKPSKYEAVQAHVKAVKKAEEVGIFYPVGSKVGFVIVKGPGNIGDRAYPIDMIEQFDGENIRIKLKSGEETKKLDKDYYIEHQIIPAVLRILERFGFSEEKIERTSQMSLESFF